MSAPAPLKPFSSGTRSPRLDTPAELAPTLPPELGAEAFLLRLARALHRRGMPSQRIEEAMMAACLRLGVQASFFSTPTALFASFDTESGRPDVYLLRTGSTSSDLGKISDLDAVTTAVIRGELSPARGLLEIDEIERQPPRYGPAITTACFAINSAAASVFFGGGLRELATAFVIGLVTGLLALIGSRNGGPWRAFEAVAAFSASVIATAAAVWFGPVATHVAVLAGLIALLPGYTLVVSMAELANGHLASGSARITAAFLAFVTLGFGVAMGTKATELVVGAAPLIQPDKLPVWVEALALAVAASTFAVLFRVKRRDIFFVLVVAVLGFSGARAGSRFLGPELGVFVGALVVAMTSNLYARVLDRPSVVPLFPGIMLLVPGSIGFRSLSSLMAHDVVSGVQTAFTMILVAIALVAGLLIANDIVPARRAL